MCLCRIGNDDFEEINTIGKRNITDVSGCMYSTCTFEPL